MTHFSNRRTLLRAATIIPFVTASTSWSADEANVTSAQTQFKLLERALDGRLGVFALNTADDTQLHYRADERFPICSTFKLLVAAGILKKSAQNDELMRRRISYLPRDLVTYSPVTEKRISTGMTVIELCDAMMRYSDNTAANLLMNILGGPAGVTGFARSIGDQQFRLDRWETDLNTAIPGDPRDTSSPEAMGRSLQRLAFGDELGAHQRKQLQDWLRNSTTGANCIRAGVPEDWEVGDKTGAGSYGTRNDVALLWPPRRPPIILTVYSTQNEKDAKWREDVIASAAQIVVGWIGKQEATLARRP
jgi:beta-lactamase class A